MSIEPRIPKGANNQEIHRDSDQVAERLWEEIIHPIHFYHGTTSVVREEINSNGLSPLLKPYDPDDFYTLTDIEAKLGLTDKSYSEARFKRQNQVFITTRRNDAINYALAGPEILSLVVLPTSIMLIEMWRDDPARLQHHGVNKDDIKKIAAIRDKLIRLLNNHQPMLVEVDKQSQALQDTLREKMGLGGDALLSPETFKEMIMDFQNAFGFDSEEEIKNLIKTDIVGALINFPIDKSIPSTDLTIIDGDEFYALTPKTRNYGNVLKTCFFDINKRPPLLVSKIIRFVQEQAHSLDVLRPTAELFTLTEDEIQKVFGRIGQVVLEKEESL